MHTVLSALSKYLSASFFSLNKFKCLPSLKHESKQTGLTRLVQWQHPTYGSVKLNTNASIKNDSDGTFAGGLLRDDQGKWLGGFVVNLELCNILRGELWGIWHGLKLAKSLDYTRVSVECDDKGAVGMILGRHEISTDCQVACSSHSLAYGILRGVIIDLCPLKG